ncbi:hypothetical protein JW933_09130 [candidate division FCPU426 bacterium]|nr:hypothetical protein [candidate division FCPU426 bacterium]
MRKEHPWQLLLLLALGIFIGSFWFLFGLLTVVGTGAAAWYHLVAAAPGGAIILFVLLARRAPVPYGAGLTALGVLLLALSLGRNGLLVTGAAVGIPTMCLGILFILWRKKIVVASA